MARIFNGIERTFAPPSVIARQRDALLGLDGRYSDQGPPAPVAARSATPIKSGASLDAAPGGESSNAAPPKPSTPTIGGSTYPYKMDPVFSPRSASTPDDDKNKTWQEILSESRAEGERAALVKEIAKYQQDELRASIDGLGEEAAAQRIRHAELSASPIGVDRFWSESQPTWRHQSYSSLPAHWTSTQKDRAIRLLQGLPDAEPSFSWQGAGSFEKAQNALSTTDKRGK